MIFDVNDTVVFIGDSITDYQRKRPCGEGLFDGLGTGYVSYIAALINCTYPDLNLRVINMGIDGNQVRDLASRWQTDLLDLKPNWVSVLIGINDVWRAYDCPQMPETHVTLEQFRESYESIIQRTLPYVKGMILMTPYYMEPNLNDAMRKKMDAFGSVVKELADKYKLVFIDLQSAWDDLFQHMHPCNIAWDRVHPNQTGSMYIAKQFLSKIGFQMQGLPDREF